MMDTAVASNGFLAQNSTTVARSDLLVVSVLVSITVLKRPMAMITDSFFRFVVGCVVLHRKQSRILGIDFCCAALGGGTQTRELFMFTGHFVPVFKLLLSSRIVFENVSNKCHHCNLEECFKLLSITFVRAPYTTRRRFYGYLVRTKCFSGKAYGAFLFVYENLTGVVKSVVSPDISSVGCCGGGGEGT